MILQGNSIAAAGDIWISHVNGRKYFIEDMVDEHLRSAIAMCERGRDATGSIVPEWALLKLPALKAEAGKRGLEIKEDGWDS